MFEARKAAGDYSSKTLKTPKFNCDTRFENYIYELYSEFRERYALLLEVLESTKEEFRHGLSTERKKADTADEIQGRMFHSKFNLSLSGMTDVYKPYSTGIKLLQTVNILPNVKYENFKKATVDTYKKMLTTLDMEKCSCTEEGEEGEVGGSSEKEGVNGEGHIQGRAHGAARGGHQQDQGGTLAAEPEPPAQQGGYHSGRE